MPLNSKALLGAAVMLAEVEEMQLTVKCSFTGAAITTVAGCGGFLLMGPAGLFVGSTIAGLGMYSYTKNKFKPVFEILRDDLRPQQQQELIGLIREGFKDVDYTDAMKLFALLMNKQQLCLQMLSIIKFYLLENFLAGVAKNNVDVDMKSKAELAMFGKYTEEYKKERGLTGMVFPPIDGSTSTPAPGWQSFLAANAAEAKALPDAAARDQAFSAYASALSQRPLGATGFDDSERQALPTVPKVPLKTTF